MNNKALLKSCLVLVCLLLAVSRPAQAHPFRLGLSVGPAIGFDTDFNKENSRNSLHLKVGLDTLYEFSCPRGGFCQGLFLQSDFTYLMGSKYSFGPTRVKGTGVIGNFSEKVTYYGGSMGFLKQFLKSSKIQPFAAMGLGFEMIKLSEVSFTDTLGNPLALNTRKSAYNVAALPSIGIFYKLSHKLSFDIAVRGHLLFPSLFNNSYFEFPLGAKYTF